LPVKAVSRFFQGSGKRKLAALAVIAMLAAGCGDGEETAAVSSSPGGGGITLSISGTPPSQILQDTQFTYTPTVSNPSGASLTFSATNLPGWATINPSTGRVTGTPTAADVGMYSGIRVTVSGGGESVSTPSFSVQVVPTATGAATLTWLPPTQNTDGSPLTNLVGYRVYWGLSPSDLTNSITLNNPGITIYVVDQLTPATWYFATTALASGGLESGFSNIASKTVM